MSGSPRVPRSQEFFDAYDKVMAKWPDGTEHLDVVTPHGTTHVHALGPRDAPPLLLLPGGGATGATWFANVAALAGERRVYAPDLIGEPGRSVRAADRPIRAVADLADWLDALLDGLGVPETELCGHSYGAWIAFRYALRGGRRVRRLTLLDPTRCYAGFAPGYLLRALPMLLRPTPARIGRFLAWETGGAALDADWLALQEAAAGFPGARPVTGPAPKSADLSVPVRVLLAGDGRVHDVARVAARAGAAATVVPGVSHHAMPLQLGPRLAELLA
ncbi:alpha/beta hydrolase [Streptomyces sp. VRA16 Mangrove soil]|uniref:alpha/beta hydrolase n=1 Tax=Streptomyces sp. VRA16 Mangrove soil TaxID=2817434 RepID=UPI001A9E8D26|nr:alpha/beta fold hydrolase [Streptomyces sp. VRA16 Mangrove soil]MBO1333277.1 alpha/beta fold hydrolase [Streptomyces sp. VRA16 Mangrove soil]